ncbi:MAG: dihydropteroate synthase, partial [Chitinophagales bacterium]
MNHKGTFFTLNTTLNCGGNLVDLSEPKIMGILNVTPDSFYDGGRYLTLSDILHQTEKMLTEGADFIDVGGMSSRPGARIISITEELIRVIPVIKAIVQRFPEALISVDTVQSQVAKEAVEAGAVMVNDISAGSIDENMLTTVGKLEVPYVLMHMLGKPETMQQKPDYVEVMEAILDFFTKKIALAQEAGIKDILLDPGFGFGKTLAHNYQILKQLDDFKIFGLPLLIGVSRKSMIYKLLKTTAKTALNGTTVLHTLALQNRGVKLLRVH